MGVLLEPFVYILAELIGIYFYVIFFEVVLHWLAYFGVANMNNRFMQTLMRVLEKLTQPVYDKIRSKVPPISGLDFSPFILLLFLMFLERLLLRVSQLLVG